MAATSLDSEFMQHWSELNVVQKKSLLSIIKSFKPTEGFDLDQYNKEIDDAITRVEKGEFFTQKEVEKMSKEW